MKEHNYNFFNPKTFTVIDYRECIDKDGREFLILKIHDKTRGEFFFHKTYQFCGNFWESLLNEYISELPKTHSEKLDVLNFVLPYL